VLTAALSQRDIEGLGANDTAIHLGNGTCSLLRGAVAYKSETLAVYLIITHDLARGDSTKRSKLRTEFVVIDTVLQVLDVEVHTLIFVKPLNLKLLKIKLIQVNRRK
jgi:hypothetical protein